MINSAEDAAAAVAATRYPPVGIRSYGPMRSGLRIGPEPAEANESVVVLAMIETPQGLDQVAEIAATPGLDGLYIGPSDLTLAVGGATPADPQVAEQFAAALVKVRAACEDNGIAAGIHTASGEIAAQRLAEGFTFVTIASELTHLELAAKAHLAAAKARPMTTSTGTTPPYDGVAVDAHPQRLPRRLEAYLRRADRAESRRDPGDPAQRRPRLRLVRRHPGGRRRHRDLVLPAARRGRLSGRSRFS